MHAPAPLPQELTIYAVGELRPQWLAWLGDLTPDLGASPGSEPVVALQASAVEQVDAAGLQLLLSLSNALKQRGCRLQLSAPSRELETACRALGLDTLIDAACAEVHS